MKELSSRERVFLAFDHKESDRVPMWYGMSEEFLIKVKKELNVDNEELLIRLGDDFRRVFAEYIGPDFPLSPDVISRTVFGIERKGLGYGQPINHPLTDASLDDVHKYSWPDPEWMDVSKIKEKAQIYNKQYAILGGDWSPFWHDLIEILGMENMYMKMYDEPELIKTILKYIVDYYIDVNRKIFDEAAEEIDIFFIGNDLGSQNGPLLSPDMFGRFILPHLKRFIDLGHEYSLKVQLHCCGGIQPLIHQMIDVGLDGLHAIQPCCIGMDLKDLKKKFGEKILFNGAIDSHHVLIDGDVELVKEKTREVLEIMKPGGGYIAGASHDSILEETPVENILAMSDAVQEYGII